MYEKGKIYVLVHDGNIIYVGSTCQTLANRLAQHRRAVKNNNLNMPLLRYMNDVGINNVKIELYENFPCGSRDELIRREGQVMREKKEEGCQILNHIIHKEDRIGTSTLGITFEDEKERRRMYQQLNREAIANDRKEFYEENKERVLQQQKEYYEKNKDDILAKQRQFRKENPEHMKELDHRKYEKNKEVILEKQKEYYQKNTEEILERNRRYREANAEKVKAHKSERHTCICGKTYTNCHKTRHERSQYHQVYLMNHPEHK